MGYLENLFDGVDVGRRSEVKSQIVLHGGLHDGLHETKKGISVNKWTSGSSNDPSNKQKQHIQKQNNIKEQKHKNPV